MTQPRLDLVAHVREQLAQGTYLTQGKLEIAAQKLLEQLEAQPVEGPPDALLRSQNGAKGE